MNSLVVFLLCLLGSTWGGKITFTHIVNFPVSDFSSVRATLTTSGFPPTLSSYGVVRIYVDIMHNYADDVRLRLYGADGTYRTISEDFGLGCDGWFANRWVYDGNGFRYGDSWLFSCPSPGSPYESFSYFRGRALNGPWSLEIYDDAGGDTGYFYSWKLEFEDGCIGNTCQNGGACTPTSMSAFTCNCAGTGYSGPTCATDINECNTNPCASKATCTNSPGSFSCTCNNGYSGNGFSCSDINECSSNPCSSNGICTNSDGSFSCVCRAGFDGNGFTCNDRDECSLGTHTCDSVNGICTNNIGSFTCGCKPGFSGSGFGAGSCVDRNECILGTHTCDTVNGICTNNIGSFTCGCKPGFSGTGFGTGSCTNINECTSGTSNCSANANCTDTLGGFTCACRDGFTGDGVTCTNINECALGTHNCSPNATCSDTTGSFACTCKSGFSGPGVTCADINECNSGLHNCDANALCTNTLGGFTCACKPGYDGSGTACQNVNECTNSGNNCHADANCTDTLGSFTCTCKTGFSGDGVTCTDINECTAGGNNCHAAATCTNSIGSFSCACNQGYTGNGTTCTDENECALSTHNCSLAVSDCVNFPGGFLCNCKAGASQGTEGCEDTNECLLGTNGCSPNGICTNTPLNYTCACKPGYTGDGFNCANMDECSLNSDNCHADADCLDTQGSWTCACKTGYYGNGVECTDYDECQNQGGGNTCSSDATCSNTPGSYNCTCKAGFTGNGFTCIDDDECAMDGSFHCSVFANCTNTPGSYFCTCLSGFQGNGQTCEDLNECLGQNGGHTCSADGYCINEDGGYSCACKDGFSGSGFTCLDDDECVLGTDTCHDNATCHNVQGGFTCSCNTGFLGDGSVCEDIDECAAGTRCHPDATCANTIGSFTCTCNTGFYGDGVLCTDYDECALETFTCHSNATCINTPGAYACSCKSGFTGDGSNCTDLNECIGENGGNDCSPNADCINTVASFSCSCKSGFVGNGLICNDVNECGSNTDNCDPNALCTNTLGSFDCTCESGFRGDGLNCTDIDECLEAINNCSPNADCTNLEGTFSCACRNGFFGNGIVCEDYDECAGEGDGDNCDANALCFNTAGTFNCTCLPEFTGDGVTCIPLAVPSASNISSLAATISWSPVTGASSYHISIQKDGVQVAGQALSSSLSTLWVSGLEANTDYTAVLTTLSIGDAQSGSNMAFFTTLPAPLSGVTLRSLTFSSLTVEFEESPGAATYSVDIRLGDNTFVATRFLDIRPTNTTKRAPLLQGTLSDLQGNTDYKLQIFAGNERQGVSFNFKTAPNPVTQLSGTRDTDTSIILRWNATAGATIYYLLVDDLHGTVVDFTFTSVNFLVSPLLVGQDYRFTLHAGNAFGIDYEHGASIITSTTTVFCLGKVEDNSIWRDAPFNQTQPGSCVPGYGGKPSRKCLISGSQGQFGPISNPCIKLPPTLATPPAAVPYSTRAVLTWTPTTGSTLFNSYVVLSDLSETPANNGLGLLLTSPTLELGSLLPLMNYTIKVYCGNAGGFESVGSSITFRTHIPPPTVFVNQTAETNVSISWTEAEFAEWYVVKVTDQYQATRVVSSRTTSTSMLVDGLEAGENYTITVFSGMGPAYQEPHGSSVQVKTLGETSLITTNPFGIDKIIGVAIGGFLGLVLLAVMIFALVVYRRHKKTTEMKQVFERELSIRESAANSSQMNLKRGSISSRRSSRSSIGGGVSDPTLLNTTMEISVPGFLLLDAASQFRIESGIGSGGSASVFKGTLLSPELIKQHNTQNVAIKRVEKVTRLSEQDNKERFLQEVSIMWSCTFHQNIAKFVGYTLEPEFYIVSKLYEIDLFTLIHHPNETISPLLALKISSDIASANAYLQEIGIVHRDLKSSNVLLETVPISPTESMIRACLCDFGLAKITASATTLDNMAIKETRGFSPRYAAPEVFANAMIVNVDSEVEKKSDVYSFGIIVWELLTRQVPWEGLEHLEIERNVRSGVRPLLPLDDQSNPATTVLIEMAKACWADDSNLRPSFAQIHTKISSLI